MTHSLILCIITGFNWFIGYITYDPSIVISITVRKWVPKLAIARSKRPCPLLTITSKMVFATSKLFCYIFDIDCTYIFCFSMFLSFLVTFIGSISSMVFCFLQLIVCQSLIITLLGLPKVQKHHFWSTPNFVWYAQELILDVQYVRR